MIMNINLWPQSIPLYKYAKLNLMPIGRNADCLQCSFIYIYRYSDIINIEFCTLIQLFS